MNLAQQHEAEMIQIKMNDLIKRLEELKADVREEELEFEDDFENYLDTKEEWTRLIDENGVAHWVENKFIKNMVDTTTHDSVLPLSVPTSPIHHQCHNQWKTVGDSMYRANYLDGNLVDMPDYVTLNKEVSPVEQCWGKLPCNSIGAW